MALTKLNDDLAYIAKLDDEPNDVGGLTPEELKAWFDKAPLAIQKYINEVLIPEIETMAVPGTGDFKADGSVTATGSFRMGGFRLTGVGDPTDAADAANRKYADGAANAAVDTHNADKTNPHQVCSQQVPVSGELAAKLGLPTTAYVEDALACVADDVALLHDSVEGAASVKIAQIQTGSYVGTGTGGAEHPNSLTFDFVPRLVIIANNDRGSTINSPILHCEALTTQYQQGYGFSSYGNIGNSYAKRSEDGKTIFWYSTHENASLDQLNGSSGTAGYTYYFIAIG